MSAFDGLPQCSFAGIVVPYESIDVQGGVRDHVHEYPHSDGGDPELLGRKLYTFRITANFHDTFRGYVDLWPDKLNLLLSTLESSTTAALVVPQYGTIQAYATSWTRQISTRVRSGEKVVIEFREDGAQVGLDQIVDEHPLEVRSHALVLDARVKDAVAAGDSLSALQKDAAITGTDRDVFDSIGALANSIFAIQDTAALNGQLYGTKLLQLASLCERADGLRSMQTTSSQPVVEALHALWAAAVRLADNVQGKSRAMQRYVTPTRMAMSDVAIALYRDASRTEDLLALNTGSYRDALAIPAGTTLVYYLAT